MTAPATLFAEHLARAVRPRMALTVSEWADLHRHLSPKASAVRGPWRTSRTPYLREIMDALSERSPVRRVVLMSSTQVGKTEVGLSWLAYVMHHAPGPMLVVLPTLEVRKRWVRQRLDPLITDSPALRELLDTRRKREALNSEDIKDFPGGMLVLGGANSPASLASMPIRYVLLDEVDRFPWQVGVEGDPIGLIDERQKTFPRRKTLLVSTPTVREASRIEEEYQHTDQRRYHVPCYHCDHLQPLVWANLRWSRNLTEARYVCSECGAEMGDFVKGDILREHGRGGAARWVPQDPTADPALRGYHLNALYTPVGLGPSWLDLAKKFVAEKDDKVTLKRFVNTSLGETWEDRSRDVRPEQLASRAEPYRLREVPPGALVLTAGIDVQDDRFAVVLMGWGRGETGFVIDWLEIPADPGREEAWTKLAEYLYQPLRNHAGREMRLEAAAIDTGGHFTHETYRWVRSQGTSRIMAVKGANTPSKPILAARPQAVDVTHRGRTIRHGVKVWMVGTDTAKHALFNRLTGDEGSDPTARRVRFSTDLPPEFYAQLTAEAFDPEKNKWVKRRRRRNEALDCWVYALAAAHHPEVRVHARRKRDWDALEAMLVPNEAPPEPEGEPEPRAKPAPPRETGQGEKGGFFRRPEGSWFNRK